MTEKNEEKMGLLHKVNLVLAAFMVGIAAVLTLSSALHLGNW